MKRLAGKHLLVTAAAQGIGRACVEAFASEGAVVHATDIDPAGLASLAGANVKTAVVNGTDPDAVQNFVSALPQLDGVVHCIGYVHQGTVLECEREQWQRSFQVNVDSFYFVLQAVLPRLIEARRGSIVCISSVASSVKGLPSRAAYGASKAALVGLVKSVAADYVGHGVRCNAVCPGTVLSPSLDQRIEALGKKLGGREKALASFVDRQPMKRLGKPAEIAGLCLYLIADESSFMTGQVLAIDGGITI